jgi:biopolymer transport protein ExbD
MQGPPPSDAGEEDEALFAEINITPLTDVFLVLLIILMVVSSSMIEEEKEAAYTKGLLAERALQVMTPQGSGAEALVPEDVTISVLPDGSLYLENDPVGPEELDARLAALQLENPLTRMVIRGDRSVSYAVVMDVVARCSRNGLLNIALASQDGVAAPD